jgi:hypothetical protein
MALLMLLAVPAAWGLGRWKPSQPDIVERRLPAPPSNAWTTVYRDSTGRLAFSYPSFWLLTQKSADEVELCPSHSLLYGRASGQTGKRDERGMAACEQELGRQLTIELRVLANPNRLTPRQFVDQSPEFFTREEFEREFAGVQILATVPEEKQRQIAGRSALEILQYHDGPARTRGIFIALDKEHILVIEEITRVTTDPMALDLLLDSLALPADAS